MNNNDRRSPTIILPRRCPECSSNSYRGTLNAHYAARHASKAQRMAPVR